MREILTTCPIPTDRLRGYQAWLAKVEREASNLIDQLTHDEFRSELGKQLRITRGNAAKAKEMIEGVLEVPTCTPTP